MHSNVVVFVMIATLPFLGTRADPQIAGCQVFPLNNAWNTPIDALPVHPSSATWVNTIGASKSLHPDFGAGLWDDAPIGIPYVVVTNSQAKVPVSFTWPDESDAGPYPIPSDAPIEGGPSSDGDRHVLVLNKDTCILYETYNSHLQADGSWQTDSGAVFNLNSNALRTQFYTSADAAGLPILPGLVRYEEVESGEIKHAIRFTVPQTRKAFVWPARHYASSLTGSQYPPMGQRFRLKASFDITKFSPANQVILKAMKKYGIILADNGSPWFISGVPDARWNDDDLHKLQAGVLGSNFEAVDASSLMINENSGEARSEFVPSTTAVTASTTAKSTTRTTTTKTTTTMSSTSTKTSTTSKTTSTLGTTTTSKRRSC